MVGIALLAAWGLVVVLAGRGDDSCVHVFPRQGRTEFQLNVFSGGHSLTAEEVASRYGLPIRGTSVLTPRGMRDVVRRRESRETGENAEAFVRLHTRVNGGAEEVWLWPES